MALIEFRACPLEPNSCFHSNRDTGLTRTHLRVDLERVGRAPVVNVVAEAGDQRGEDLVVQETLFDARLAQHQERRVGDRVTEGWGG